MSLIVGGGLTGSAAFYFLRYGQNIGPISSSLIQYAFDGTPMTEIWEKSSHIGGRMRNVYPNDVIIETEKLSQSCIRSDVGAQYITMKNKQSEFTYVYEYLLNKNVFSPLDKPIIGVRSNHYNDNHFVCPLGTSEIVKELLMNKSPMNFDLTSLDLSDDESKWIAKYRTHDGMLSSAEYSVVFLAIPPPNLFKVSGNWMEFVNRNQLGKAVLEGLKDVRYSSRYALTVFLPRECREDLNGRVDWLAKYVDDDEVIRYISIESRKLRSHEIKESDLECLIIHTTVPFGIRNIDESSDNVIKTVLESLAKHVPEISKYLSNSKVDLIKWEYSQVSRPLQIRVDGRPSPRALVLTSSNNAKLVIIGDSFTESNFEGCLESAYCGVKCLLTNDSDCS